MVSTFLSVCEVLLNGERDFTTSSLFQGRTEICATFLWAVGVQGGKMCIHLCAQDGDIPFSQRLTQVNRNIQERLD